MVTKAIRGATGADRVHQVIAEHQHDAAFSDRRPMAARALERVRQSVPASLAAWLAFDSRSPNREISLLEKRDLALRSTKELFEHLVVSASAGEDWEEDTRIAMNDLAATVPGEALLLREPCGQDHFLYLCRREDFPEGVVLALEDEALFVAWSGFDAYVAHQLGTPAADDAVERAACEQATRLLFG